MSLRILCIAAGASAAYAGNGVHDDVMSVLQTSAQTERRPWDFFESIGMVDPKKSKAKAAQLEAETAPAISPVVEEEKPMPFMWFWPRPSNGTQAANSSAGEPLPSPFQWMQQPVATQLNAAGTEGKWPTPQVLGFPVGATPNQGVAKNFLRYLATIGVVVMIVAVLIFLAWQVGKKPPKEGTEEAVDAAAQEQEEAASSVKRNDPKRLDSSLKILTIISKKEVALMTVGVASALALGCSQPLMSKLFGNLVHQFFSVSLMAGIKSLCVRMVVIGSVMGFLGSVQFVCFDMAVKSIMVRVRTMYANAVIYKDVDWFDVREIGTIPPQMSADCEGIQGMFELFGPALTSFSGCVSGWVFAFLIGWHLAVAMLFIMPFLVVGIIFSTQKVMQTVQETQGWYAKADSIVEEALYAVRTVISLGGERHETMKYHDAAEETRQGGIWAGFEVGATLGFTQFVLMIGYALSSYSSMLLKNDGIINPARGVVYSGADFVSIMTCLLIGTSQISGIFPWFQAVQSGRVCASRFFEAMEEQSKIQCHTDNQGKLVTSIDNIKLVDVHFSYPSKPDVKVLNGLSLSVMKGQKVAVVGESGSGKSTVLSLLERFYDPHQGTVLVNGEDMRNFSVRALRRCIGYVGQEPVLFATSIRENIFQGSPNSTADDLAQACADAQLTFVEALPDGLDTFVGNGGSQFSGGQKQRIAIARALIKKASILLLDEATSALDNASEKMIQATISHMMNGESGKKLTMVTIAHRLSTVRDADVIYVVSGGQVAESGDHTTLMEAHGLYHSLAASQEGPKREPTPQPAAIAPSATQALALPDAGRLHGIMKGFMGCGRRYTTGAASVLKSGRMTRTEAAQRIALADAKKEVKFDVKSCENQVAEKKLSREEALEKELAAKYDDMTVFWRLFEHIGKEGWFFIPALLGSFVEGASMPFLAWVMSKGAVTLCISISPEVMKHQTMRIIMWFLICGVALQIACVARQTCFAVVGETTTKNLRVKILGALLKQEVGYYDDPQNAPGVIQKMLQVSAFRVSNIFRQLGILSAVAMNVIVGFVVAFKGTWQVCVVIMAGYPILIGIGVLQIKIQYAAYEQELSKQKEAHKILVDTVQNVRTVKACGNEADVVNLYDRLSHTAVDGYVRRSLQCGCVYGLSSSLMFFFQAGAFYYAGYLVDKGIADLFHVCMSYNGIQYTIVGLMAAISMGSDIARAYSAAREIFTILDREPKINAMNAITDTNITVEVGYIEFQDVHFVYPFRPDVRVLNGASFSIHPGQSVGIVGYSGGGKSTIMALLQRFYDPDQGAMLVGKERIPVSRLNIRWWRQQVGFVGQEPVLFNTTVKENVLYGLEDHAAPVTDGEWLDKCKKMSNLNFLDKVQGWDMEVGPRGLRLSGGQKQRVAICRALARNPQLLLLDEATSALDTQSERVVQDALEAARQGRTSFTIAHRLSTVVNCDVIMVVAEGRVVESGTHTNLIAREGVYYELYKHSQR